MKISDALWRAACRISDKENYRDLSCQAIHHYSWDTNGADSEKARSFYQEIFSPKPYQEIWFGREIKEKEQLERFFHLLMAYEMAKGMRL